MNEDDGHNRGITLVDIAEDGTGHTLSWPLSGWQHGVIRQFLEMKLGPSPESILMSPEDVKTITDLTEEHMIVLRDQDGPEHP